MSAALALAARTAPIRLVVFDCDGVLVDSEPLTNRIVAEMITEVGWPMTAAECEHFFLGMNLEAMLPIITNHIGRPLPGGWIERMTDRLVRLLATDSAPIAGAIAALDGVTALGLPWRVASNSSHVEMDAKFACLGLSERVAGRLHSFTDVASGKPAPDIYLAAAAAEGVDPAHCVVIEDSVTGTIAAVAAGMLCLGYAPHGDNPRLRAAGAHLFADMGALPALLAGTRP